jgi:acetoin utilization protein AcuB
MIVRDIMTTKLVTIAAEATLAHAANLLRQHQFHHLPVVRDFPIPSDLEENDLPVSTYIGMGKSRTIPVLEGLITSEDIDLAAAAARQQASSTLLGRSWTEKHIYEVMHRALLRVTPTTSVAAAAQLLVERNLNYLPVVEYIQIEQESKPVLLGLVTRSDLLLALARAMGTFEPGMQLDILLPMGDMQPLARTLQMASELHMSIRSVIAAPLTESVPTIATIRLGTINPMPLLIRLQAEEIHYTFGAPLSENSSEAGGD